MILLTGHEGFIGSHFLRVIEEELREPVICIDKEIDEVLHTLAHEFSHLMQWYEDDPCYLAWEKRSCEKHNYDLEVDAESRALALLEEWGLYNEKARERSAKYLSELGGHDANL